MRRAVLAGGAVIVILLALWIAAGALVWSRNSYAATTLARRRTPPADNAYTAYTSAVQGVRETGEISKLFAEPAGPPAKYDGVLRKNEPVLTAVHAAASRPSVVTDLAPRKDFVAAIDFPNVSRLLVLEARARSSRAKDRMLEPILDGVRFSEGVMRGGAMLHLLTGFLAYAPLFEAAPEIIRAAPAKACGEAASRLRSCMEDGASLEEFVENEHAVRMRQLTSTFPSPGRVFRFDIPWEGYERDFTLKPKAPAVDGLNRYFEAWKAQSKQPIKKVSAPAGPVGLEGILNDDSMGPEEMGKRFMQFYWREARLRMVHAMLLLERHRKEKGAYPEALSALGHDPLMTDPFSGQPLVYRRSGAEYVLYSVGPNGKDDGGISMNEARLDPGREGDLPINPTFGRR